jgi:hypothetical protein
VTWGRAASWFSGLSSGNRGASGDAGTLGVAQQLGGVTVVGRTPRTGLARRAAFRGTGSILDENAIAAGWNALDRHARWRDQDDTDLQTRGRKIALNR